MIKTSEENEGATTDLVTAAAAGDEVAWAILVGRITPTLRSIARAHRLGEADVDDVVQECWVRLASHMAELRDPAAVYAWLGTTARRQSIQIIRQRLSTCDVESLADRADESSSPADLAAQRDSNTRLRKALGRLSGRDERLLSALSTSSRPSYARVSNLLGLPIGSIGPTRARALQRLRRELEIEGLSA